MVTTVMLMMRVRSPPSLCGPIADAVTQGAGGIGELGLVPVPLAHVTTPEEHIYRASKFRSYITRWFKRTRFLRYRRVPVPPVGSKTPNLKGSAPIEPRVLVSVENEPQLTGLSAYAQPGATPPDRFA
jgi:hypothetical protein